MKGKIIKKFLTQFFCSNYFLVFTTNEANYCWRVVNKKFLCSVPEMVLELTKKLENEGKTAVALIQIKKL